MFLSLGIVGNLQAKEKDTYDVIINQQKEVTAVYDGHTLEEDYKFTLDDGTSMMFQTVAPEVLKSFNLMSDELKGTKFKIMYTTTQKDGKDLHTIVGLEKVE